MALWFCRTSQQQTLGGWAHSKRSKDLLTVQPELELELELERGRLGLLHLDEGPRVPLWRRSVSQHLCPPAPSAHRQDETSCKVLLTDGGGGDGGRPKASFPQQPPPRAEAPGGCGSRGSCRAVRVGRGCMGEMGAPRRFPSVRPAARPQEAHGPVPLLSGYCPSARPRLPLAAWRPLGSQGGRRGSAESSPQAPPRWAEGEGRGPSGPLVHLLGPCPPAERLLVSPQVGMS